MAVAFSMPTSLMAEDTKNIDLNQPTPQMIKTIHDLEKGLNKPFPEFEYALYTGFNKRAKIHPFNKTNPVPELTECQTTEYQHNLLTLGFNLGPAGADGVKGRLTNEATRMFQFYFAPLIKSQTTHGLLDQTTIDNVRNVAHTIQKMSKEYKTPQGVLTAIYAASQHTGEDFSYLMELAFSESSFRTQIKARRSSAFGLYQFTNDTWLFAIHSFGHKYQLGFYADQIEFLENEDGKLKPILKNPVSFKHVASLRQDPYLSAIMAAELAQLNSKSMDEWNVLPKGSHRTSKYLGHFFGIKDSIIFGYALKHTPNAKAADVFAKLAKANPAIFYNKRKARSFQEIYSHFSKKFDTGHFEQKERIVITKATDTFGCKSSG